MAYMTYLLRAGQLAEAEFRRNQVRALICDARIDDRLEGMQELMHTQFHNFSVVAATFHDRARRVDAGGRCKTLQTMPGTAPSRGRPESAAAQGTSPIFGRFAWWAHVDLNHGPHPYQGCGKAT
jgi:hypothetical protein